MTIEIKHFIEGDNKLVGVPLSNSDRKALFELVPVV